MKDENSCGLEDDNIDWDSEDEREIDSIPISSCSSLTFPGRDATTTSAEAHSSAGSSNSKLFDNFLHMGFSEKMVSKAIQENGEENEDSILETLLTYSALEEPNQEQQIVSDQFSSDYDGSFLDDFSDLDSISDNEQDIKNSASGDQSNLKFLLKMGYTVHEASIAIERCGLDSSLAELTDFIFAAQMAKAADNHLGEFDDEEEPRLNHLKKRREHDHMMCKEKKQRRLESRILTEDNKTIRLPNPMIGFGVPTSPSCTIHRIIPEAAIGPPYFYYENVALAPKGVWDTISRFLYDVEPEFVDSKYFCAAARKRGYIHNLPIEKRYPLLPLTPLTIHEALPITKRWWPSWDTRTQLNCLQTKFASAKLTEKIWKVLDNHDGVPPAHVQKYVLYECRKWNLVWVGKNKVAPLEPDEVEKLLGFPMNHTRGGGICRNNRYKSLGNSFQVDTVAYHLSVLKDMYPGGINLLSLFSGIGGAEVALHRLRVPLKNVVMVEKSEANRNIIRSWWEQTNQKGNLVDLVDVQQLNGDCLEQLMNSFGGFDLVVGGSPCNNLSGSNRYHRDGLEGEDSSLFFDYFRILDLVKCITTKRY